MSAYKSIPVRLRERANGCDAELDVLLRLAADHIEQLQHDMREQEREFQREARDIAAEARWKATQGEDYGRY